MAAVSILTSAAAFDKQCERVGLAAEWIAAMQASGITTLGKLSYAVSLPGTQPTADEMDNFTATLRPGARVTLGDSSAIKQLIFEAQTMTVAELRATMQSSDEVSWKLPASERSMRIEDQKQRLKGLPLEGPLSVAHCVYDKLANMRENDELKYLSPGECITRDAELCCEKPPKALQLDANKMGIVVKDEEALATMSVDSDLQLYQAMMRRALAMDLVGLASYDMVQKWNERLFRIMSQDPPPEFQKVSRAQVLRADRQCFLELARTCNGNLKPDAKGVLPLDKEFEKLEYNQSVMYFLLPVKGKGKGSGKPGDKGNGRKRTQDTTGDGKNKKLKITRDPIPDALKGDLIAHVVPEECEAAAAPIVPMDILSPGARVLSFQIVRNLRILLVTSSFWTTDFGKSLLESSVDIDLKAFGSPTPGCIRFASSMPLVLRSCASLAAASRQKPSTDIALGQLYRALASVMLEHLHVRTPPVPPLAAAQVHRASQVDASLDEHNPDASDMSGGVQQAAPPPCGFAGSLLCATECEAEMLASNLDARVDASSLVSIFEALPAEVPARGVDDAREKAWTAGAYSQNKLCGLRKHTRAFPRVVSAAVRYLRGCFPGACFATIAFYSNVCTPMHRDSNNLEGTLNYVAPLLSKMEAFGCKMTRAIIPG
ncbi:unnamed protein product [Symbiodinium sp. CCMP2592]|nr:unnamed protein product [Symbiodinium sp. CCMP2592]